MTVVCTICLGKLTAARINSAIACGHVFHDSCFRKWVREQQRCPICGAAANGKEGIQRLYLNFETDSEEVTETIQKLQEKVMEQNCEIATLEEAHKKVLKQVSYGSSEVMLLLLFFDRIAIRLF